MRLFRSISIIGALYIISLTMVTSLVFANGKPVKIFLNYLSEVSNYGPTDAYGVALLSIGEAWIELTVDSLPQLTGESYEVWLVTANQEDLISLGKFNTDINGHADYAVQFDNIPVLDYRYLIITVEPEPDPNVSADARWSIAGIFPDPEILIVTETPEVNDQGTTSNPDNSGTSGSESIDSVNLDQTTGQEGNDVPTPPAPTSLPVTGSDEPIGLKFTWVIMSISVILFYYAYRLRK